MSRNSRINAALQAVYDQVPVMIGCTGECWISCGPVSMSDHEHKRIRQAGYRVTPEEQAVQREETSWCEALTEAHRCAVYEIRPVMCRLWGTTKSTRCPFGCMPEGGFLSEAERLRLIAEADRIGGRDIPHPVTERSVAAAMEDPEVAAELERRETGGLGGIGLRTAHLLPPAFRRQRSEAPCPACGFTLVIPQGKTSGQCQRCGVMLILDGDQFRTQGKNLPDQAPGTPPVPAVQPLPSPTGMVVEAQEALRRLSNRRH